MRSSPSTSPRRVWVAASPTKGTSVMQSTLPGTMRGGSEVPMPKQRKGKGKKSLLLTRKRFRCKFHYFVLCVVFASLISALLFLVMERRQASAGEAASNSHHSAVIERTESSPMVLASTKAQTDPQGSNSSTAKEKGQGTGSADPTKSGQKARESKDSSRVQNDSHSPSHNEKGKGGSGKPHVGEISKGHIVSEGKGRGERGKHVKGVEEHHAKGKEDANIDKLNKGGVHKPSIKVGGSGQGRHGSSNVGGKDMVEKGKDHAPGEFKKKRDVAPTITVVGKKDHAVERQGRRGRGGVGGEAKDVVKQARKKRDVQEGQSKKKNKGGINLGVQKPKLESTRGGRSGGDNLGHSKGLEKEVKGKGQGIVRVRGGSHGRHSTKRSPSHVVLKVVGKDGKANAA